LSTATSRIEVLERDLAVTLATIENSCRVAGAAALGSAVDAALPRRK
jgi:hypothetical protein